MRAQVKIATAQQAQAVARYGSRGADGVPRGRERPRQRATAGVQTAAGPERRRATAREAVRIATVQYKAGRRDLLWVSQLQTGQLANEADLIKLSSLQRVNRVQLYLALGGSFDPVPAATVQQID